MVCQYSRPSPVSSEKHQVTLEAGVEWRGGHTAGVATVAVGMGGYWTRPDRLAVSSLVVKAAI
jgi:hypothetical protein